MTVNNRARYELAMQPIDRKKFCYKTCGDNEEVRGTTL